MGAKGLKHRLQGFTLIELSIVLVIIGLIVGGVLVGRDLLAAAAVRAQISQIEKYQQAVNTFKGKYGYLPGDIPNPIAGQFGFQTRGLLAGQGDGNGVLETTFGGTSHLFQGEEGMFWVDLSHANLIDGSFTTATPSGVFSGNGPTGSAIGNYLPQSKIGSSGYVYVWSGGWQSFAGQPDSINYFAISGVTGSGWSVPLMTVAQAYAIDKKMDDGLPQFGNVLAMDTGMFWASGGPTTGCSVPCENNWGDFAFIPSSSGGKMCIRDRP